MKKVGRLLSLFRFTKTFKEIQSQRRLRSMDVFKELYGEWSTFFSKTKQLG
jgi:hypothetical protein